LCQDRLGDDDALRVADLSNPTAPELFLCRSFCVTH
jgi:hypothetical protein